MDVGVLVTLSHATYGATAAATHLFVTADYKPPVQERYIDTDVVKNQNGQFKYVYDNGPGFKKWQAFQIRCEDAFSSVANGLGATQYAHLLEMWNHPGVLGMATPEGVHTVHWGKDLERAFRVFPKKTGDHQEFSVTVQFEEGQ